MKRVLPQSVVCNHPLCCIFLCCFGPASKHQGLFQTWENSYRNNLTFMEQYMEMKPCRVHFSSNGLGNSEWDMKILKVI